MKKIVLLLCLLMTSLLFACQEKEKDPVSIYLDPIYFGSSPTFEVDEELVTDGMMLKLVYSDNSTKEIPLERDMVEGFSTVTTGQKSMHATYRDIKSNEISYYVSNPEGVYRTIETSTRIAVTKTYSDGKQLFSFSLRSNDFSIRALSFTLTGSAEMSDTLSELHGMVENGTESFYWKKTATNAVNIVLYAPKDTALFSTFFTLEWFSPEDLTISLSDIVASDGNKDYYLPKV